MTRPTRRALIALGAMLLVTLLGVGGWVLYYRRLDRRCIDGKRADACDRVVRIEQFICDHGLPASPWTGGGCSVLGSRYFLGLGVPKDIAKSIAFERRSCVAPLDVRRVASCYMAWFFYAEAFTGPHFTMVWSGSLDGPDYTPNYARPLETVLREAEALCASDFAGRTFSTAQREFVGTLCGHLPDARLAFEDARANGPGLVRLCDSGNMGACLLAGAMVTYGIGMPRDIERGKAFLRRACDKGDEIACHEVGANGKRRGPLLEILETAIAGEAAEPRRPE